MMKELKMGNPETDGWFNFSESGGNLNGNEASTIILNLIGGLTSGNYSAKITISHPGGPTSFVVKATVTKDPIAKIPSVDISFSNDQASFEIGNDGAIDSIMSWAVTDSERTRNSQSLTDKWFNFNKPTSGDLSGNEAQKITLDLISGLAPGNYSSKVTVDHPGGPTDFVVTAIVNLNTSEVQVRVNAASLEIINPTNQDLKWTIQLTNSSSNPEAGDWFNVTPKEGVAEGQSNSGTSLQPISVISLEPEENLKEGLYISTLSIVFDQVVNCVPTCNFDVRVQVLYPEPVIPSADIKLEDKATFSIANEGNKLTRFDWNIKLRNITLDGGTTDPWFSIDPVSGTVFGESSQEVTLSLNKDLVPGDYSAILRVNYNNGERENFEVTTTIRPAEEGEGFVPITPLSLQSGGATFLY